MPRKNNLQDIEEQLSRLDSLIEKWNSRVAYLEGEKEKLVSRKNENDIETLLNLIREKNIPVETILKKLR